MGELEEDLLGELLTEEEMKELPDYYESWPVKLLAKAINNMTKLRDRDRTMCEILDTTMSVMWKKMNLMKFQNN